MSIASNLNSIKATIPNNVTLVAVSKTHPVNQLMEAYNAGQRLFGENKVQELVAKAEAMPIDVQWHMIGHLQSNKVKYIAPFVSLIHGVDSIKLLQAIDKEGGKNNRKIDCLLQIHIATEETKHGFDPKELDQVFLQIKQLSLRHVRIRGLMGMATFTEQVDVVRSEFARLKSLFDHLKSDTDFDSSCFDIISMGMSDDYQLAIEEGSTMVRIGSSIFGYRTYQT
jgi:PLP dependent protein